MIQLKKRLVCVNFMLYAARWVLNTVYRIVPHTCNTVAKSLQVN